MPQVALFGAIGAIGQSIARTCAARASPTAWWAAARAAC